MSKIKLDFRLWNEAEIKTSKVNLDAALVLLAEPFLGRFYMKDDSRDLMSTSYNVPIAYAEWFLDNLSSWHQEDNSERTDKWKARHTFATALGDFSPEIILFRSKNRQIIVPPIEGYGAVYVPAEEFYSEVRRISARALEILARNPRFVTSKRFRKMNSRFNEYFK